MSTTPFVKFKQDLGDGKVALNTVGYGMTESGIWLPIKVTDEGVQEVRQSGTIFGADISDRPPANSVPVGTTFVIANTVLDTWISNGTDWVAVIRGIDDLLVEEGELLDE
jgi:hypothetical protein